MYSSVSAYNDGSHNIRWQTDLIIRNLIQFYIYFEIKINLVIALSTKIMKYSNCCLSKIQHLPGVNLAFVDKVILMGLFKKTCLRDKGTQ